MDNKITDEYFYQITIQTGSRRDAETSSKIFFVVNGEEDQSELRILASNGNMVSKKILLPTIKVEITIQKMFKSVCIKLIF